MKNYETLNILFDDLETICSRKFENCTKIQYQDILDLIDETMKKYKDKYTEDKEEELYDDLEENIIESLCFEWKFIYDMNENIDIFWSEYQEESFDSVEEYNDSFFNNFLDIKEERLYRI